MDEKEILRLPKFSADREDDYELWSMRLMALLEGKEYADIVTGAEQAPDK